MSEKIDNEVAEAALLRELKALQKRKAMLKKLGLSDPLANLTHSDDGEIPKARALAQLRRRLREQLLLVEHEMVETDLLSPVDFALNKSGLHHFGGKVENLGRLALLQNPMPVGKMHERPSIEVNPPWLVLPPEAYQANGTTRVYPLKELLEGRMAIEQVVNGRTFYYQDRDGLLHLSSWANGPSRGDYGRHPFYQKDGGFTLLEHPLEKGTDGRVVHPRHSLEHNRVHLDKLLALHAEVLRAFPAGTKIVLRPSFEGEDNGYSPPGQGSSICFELTEDPEPFARTLDNIVGLGAYQTRKSPRAVLVGPEVPDAKIVVQAKIQSRKKGYYNPDPTVIELFLTHYRQGASLKDIHGDEHFGYDYVERLGRSWRPAELTEVAAVLEGLDPGQAPFNKWGALRSPEGPSYQQVVLPVDLWQGTPDGPAWFHQSSLFSEQVPSLMELTKELGCSALGERVEFFFSRLYLELISRRMNLENAYEKALDFFLEFLSDLSKETGLKVDWPLDVDSPEKIPFEPYQSYIMMRKKQDRHSILKRTVEKPTPEEILDQLKGIHMALLRGKEQAHFLEKTDPRLAKVAREVTGFNRVLKRGFDLEYIVNPSDAVAVQFNELPQVDWAIEDISYETDRRRGNMNVQQITYKEVPPSKKPVLLPKPQFVQTDWGRESSSSATYQTWQPLCFADTVYGSFDRTATRSTVEIPGYCKEVFAEEAKDKKGTSVLIINRRTELTINNRQLVLGHMTLYGGHTSNHGHVQMTSQFPFHALSGSMIPSMLQTVRSTLGKGVPIRVISDGKKGGLFVSKETMEQLSEKLV